ncbi:MAG TPA: substrate-binding domain-containing protein [Granulicella sp.]|jgi:ribose transport system substrate-binding protein|nr:substrate-binding domain-containing protein [Granulicella sp.]
MRNWSARLVLAALAVGALSMMGCQGHSKRDVYYLISNNLKLPYWTTVSQGFSKAAAEYGVTARIDGPNTYDPQAELLAFERAVVNKPAGILISVADAALLRPEINSAIEAGIPVITVDSDAPTSSRLYFIGTNNLEVGHLGGQRLLDKLHGKGNVVFYTIAGQPNLEERLKGYNDILASHLAIKVMDIFDTKGDPGRAFDQTEQYLGRTGAEKIDAFVCLESSSGKAIAEVLKRKNVTDRVVVAMDVDPDTLNLIKEGTLEATVTQKPFTMGYVGLKALDEIHHNHPKAFRSNYAVDSFSEYPAFVDTGTALVDKFNADLYLASAAQAVQQ